MKEKAYQEFIEKTGGKTTTHSLEEDIRLTADLDETFKEAVFEIGVAELAMHIAFHGAGQNKKVAYCPMPTLDRDQGATP